jgi:hypothetical protein
MTISKIPFAGISNSNNFRNIIINGDMSIAQRGTSFTGLGNGDSQYTLDRFRFEEAGAPTFEFTLSQDTNVPTGQGFATSLKMDCTTAQGSLASGDACQIVQKLEGQMLQYLKKGTANAESLTLSFWVKSNKTGTYIFEIFDNDNSRTISKSYTVDVSNTWEKKTITLSGDTTGSFNNDNGQSAAILFWLGAGTNFTSGTLQTSWGTNTAANRAVGQVNLADDTANEWYITGVQLEAGTTASDFEFLPHDVNLARCQRYFQLLAEGDNKTFGNALYYNSTQVYSSQQYFKTMRATPSLDHVSVSNYYEIFRNGASDAFGTFVLNANSTTNYFELQVTAGVAGTGGQAGWFRTSNADAYIALNAEL